MQIPFAILAALTVVSAIAAVSLRNLVHCTLAVAVAFAGIAALYLQLGAPFAGWTQVLVYIGAVAILIVFAILLTHTDHAVKGAVFSKSWMAGLAISLFVFGVMAYAILHSATGEQLPSPKPEPTVREIGIQLMTRYVLPLETIGLLLTASAIGAVIIALRVPAAKALSGAAKTHEGRSH
jgi:NADH-quinone oxidoreductase subunit J